MPIIKSACSSSSSASMESVKYEQKYNPEAITNYYSCGVQTGRSNNEDVKDLILKAKQHLSAIGWSFNYIYKISGRRELRYHSPGGKNYCSLRTACQSLIKHQDHYNPELQTRIFNHDVEIGGSKIEELKEPEECSSNNRPKKRIRIQDVENSYFHQQRDQELLVNSNREGKRLQDVKRTMESTKKCIRKVEAASSTRRRSVLLLLIEKNIVLRGSRVVYRNKKDDILAKGVICEQGIQCDCCGEVFLLSKFEAHAGSTYHRPAANIFLDDGRSLFDCQTELQHESTDNKSTKSPHSVMENDGFCSFCNDGGDLLCCDSCTSSFHSTCIGLNEIPDSVHWFCPSCCCRICHLGNQISKCSMEDSHNHEKIMKCRQCDHQFHIDCITKLGFSVPSVDSTNWFCSENCEKIHFGLMKISGRHSIPITINNNNNNLSWSLLKLDTDVNEMYKRTETYSKLKVALDVMHECFKPIKHRWSEKDLVEDLIFSRCTKRSNFEGFFTAVLERDDEMITVVTVRVHGCKVAEIPLVATRFRYRRLGMCRILMDEVERMLGELGIERVVLPAVPEMISTWTESFGFRVMMENERLDLVECKFLGFPGTIICQKILKKM